MERVCTNRECKLKNYLERKKKEKDEEGKGEEKKEEEEVEEESGSIFFNWIPLGSTRSLINFN